MKSPSKLGRKGDPRMHKAVAARLANPKLSLYEALCIGGFEYAENDDKSVLDSKQVTLGQRKNQLSRRLRLSRKQDMKRCSPNSSIDGNSVTGNNYSTEPNSISPDLSQTCDNNVMGNETKTSQSTEENNRAKVDLINELATGGMNSNANGDGDGDGMDVSQFKRQRLACSSAPMSNHKLNINHSLHQGWLLGGMPNLRGDDPMLGGGPLLGSSPGVNLAPAPFFNSQLTNRIPEQPLSRFQSGASAVAVSSLASTAQSVGLTLDQLALTLSSNTTSLSKLVSDARSGESENKQEQMALDIFQSDVKGLYTKSLLVAGVDASLAEQNTPRYINFAVKAWEVEGRRLRALRNAINGGKDTQKHTVAFADPAAQHRHGTPTRMNKSIKDNNDNDNATTTSDWGDNSQNDHSHDHHHGNEHNHSHNHNENGSEKHDSTKCDARHMHRIGECGHRAVIHKPKDGAAHIDFIVNDQIECYQGQDSMSLAGMSLAGQSAKSYDSVWPSKYKCKEVDGSGAKSCGRNLGVPPFDNNWAHLEPIVQEPKTFKLSEIDTSDPEWTFDTGEEVDGGVMGLFELSSRDNTSPAT